VQTKLTIVIKVAVAGFFLFFVVNIVEPKMEAFEVALVHRMTPSASEDVLRSCFVCIVPSVA